jgi:hypothetical protein
LTALDTTKTLLSEYPILGTINESKVEDAVLVAFHW